MNGVTDPDPQARYNPFMGRVLTIAAILFVSYVAWQRFGEREERPQFSEDSSSAMQAVDIEVYTTSRCGYCRRAKAYMDEHGIAYVEKNVENDRELLREFHSRGGKGVPYFFINGEPMRGWEPARFEQALADSSS